MRGKIREKASAGGFLLIVGRPALAAVAIPIMLTVAVVITVAVPKLVMRVAVGLILRMNAMAAVEMIAAEMPVRVANISVLPVEIVEIAVAAPIAAAIRSVKAVVIERHRAMRPAVIAVAGRAAAEQEKSRGGADQGFRLRHNVSPPNAAPPVFLIINAFGVPGVPPGRLRSERNG